MKRYFINFSLIYFAGKVYCLRILYTADIIRYVFSQTLLDGVEAMLTVNNYANSLWCLSL